MLPFLNLKTSYTTYQAEYDTAVARALASGWYILGPEVEAFEAEFAAYSHLRHAIGVASGTDAVLLALKGLGIGAGDEVITVAHTAVATVTAVELAGATPVLVDIDPHSYTIDPSAVSAAITPRTKAIVAVHLYGHPADLDPLQALAQRHGLALVEDCAQAHGAQYKGQPVGSIGDASAFSFYPTKNLGAMGDGGLVGTRHADVAERVRWLRQYGWQERYISQIAGYNSRLDELQAAILRVGLAHLDEGNGARRQLAAEYGRLLAPTPLRLPTAVPHVQHVYHLYVIQTPQRDELAEQLRQKGVGTAVHYPVPIHRQPAYAHLGYAQGSLPTTETAAQQVLSLPLYPQLAQAQVAAVAQALAEIIKNKG